MYAQIRFTLSGKFKIVPVDQLKKYKPDCPTKICFAKDGDVYLKALVISVRNSEKELDELAESVRRRNPPANLWSEPSGDELLSTTTSKPKEQKEDDTLNIVNQRLFLKNPGGQYLVFLRETLPELQRRFGLQQPEWFQHDGAPTHYPATVREYLNGQFPNRWFGRNGPSRWPPRSPDLTPLDFFLWGHFKAEVYATEPADEMETMARIMATQTTITPEMLAEMRINLIARCHLCIQQNGRHFEHLLD